MNNLTKKGLNQAVRDHYKAEMVQMMSHNYKKIKKIRLDYPQIAKEYPQPPFSLKNVIVRG